MAQRGGGDIGVIAVRAEMAEPQAAEAGRGNLGDERGRLVSAEVAVAAGDPLLGCPRAFGIGSEELRAVVGLQKKRVQFPQARQHAGGRVAEIADHAETRAGLPSGGSGGLNDEAHRVHRVVRN